MSIKSCTENPRRRGFMSRAGFHFNGLTCYRTVRAGFWNASYRTRAERRRRAAMKSLA
jgi:hypothetical protein